MVLAARVDGMVSVGSRYWTTKATLQSVAFRQLVYAVESEGSNLFQKRANLISLSFGLCSRNAHVIKSLFSHENHPSKALAWLLELKIDNHVIAKANNHHKKEKNTYFFWCLLTWFIMSLVGISMSIKNNINVELR